MNEGVNGTQKSVIIERFNDIGKRNVTYPGGLHIDRRPTLFSPASAQPGIRLALRRRLQRA